MYKKHFTFILLLNIIPGFIVGMALRSKSEYHLMLSCSSSPYVENRKQLKEEKVKKLIAAGVNVNTQNPAEYGSFPLKEVLEAHADYTSFIAIEQKKEQPDSENLARYTKKQQTAERILQLLLNVPGINLNLKCVDIHSLELYCCSWKDSAKRIDPAIVKLLVDHKTSNQFSIPASVIEEALAAPSVMKQAVPILKQALAERTALAS